MKELVEYAGFWLCVIATLWMTAKCWPKVKNADVLAILTIISAQALLVWGETLRFKVYGDDVAIACTAKGLATELKQTSPSGVDLSGHTTFEYLDKRPPLASFLGAVMREAHAIGPTNYVKTKVDPTRAPLCVAYANAFLLGPLFIGALYWLLKKISEKHTAALATLVASGLPLTGFVFTGGGLEPAYIVGLIFTLGFLLEDNVNGILCAITWTTLSRYEGSLVGLGALLFLMKTGKISRKQALPSCLALLAIAHTVAVTYISHRDRAALFTQIGNTSETFGLTYLFQNIGNQLKFLFTIGGSLPNTPTLAFAAIWCLGLSIFSGTWRRLSGLWIFLITALSLLPYFWGDSTDPTVWRLMLPELVALVIIVAHGLSTIPKGWVRIGALLLILTPALYEKAKRGYEKNTNYVLEYDWMDKHIQSLMHQTRSELHPAVLINPNMGWAGIYEIEGIPPQIVESNLPVFKKEGETGTQFFMIEIFHGKTLTNDLAGTISRPIDSKSFSNGTTLRFVEKTF